MLSGFELYAATPSKRKIEIMKSLPAEFHEADEIRQAELIADIINSFIEDYLAAKETDYFSDPELDPRIYTVQRRRLAEKIDRFLPIATAKLRSLVPTLESLVTSSRNLYELSGSIALSFSNQVTRNLSTTMGNLWEELATISPYAVNPDIDFHIKVKGVDLISKNVDNGLVEFMQLKTQQNTLTGSQKTRSEQELSIHVNPVFCACFKTRSNWTFKSNHIPRVAGGDFWSRIGLNYSIVLDLVRDMMRELEAVYVGLLNENIY
jgi:hypothetical protein